MSEEKETIWVKSKKPERVALYERNAAHPGGEVYVSGKRAFEVAVTRDVRDKLRTQELIEINESEATKLNEAADKEATERREEALAFNAQVEAAQKLAGENLANAALDKPVEPVKETPAEPEQLTAEGVGHKPLGGEDDKPAAPAKAKK